MSAAPVCAAYVLAYRASEAGAAQVFVLERRDDTPKFPGCFDLPGGKADAADGVGALDAACVTHPRWITAAAHDALEKTAQRECEEEVEIALGHLAAILMFAPAAGYHATGALFAAPAREPYEFAVREPKIFKGGRFVDLEELVRLAMDPAVKFKDDVRMMFLDIGAWKM